MSYIDEKLFVFKEMIEESIINGGAEGKASMIRSSQLINLIHDAVKYELLECGVEPSQIYPHLGETKPEIKLAGFLKQKDQDVCVVPRGISRQPQIINWGPMSFQNKMDLYGFSYSENTLVINVRSQMSSLTKNSDTLFERTFAEAQNLHMRYPDIVLGEVYLIPVNEYDDAEIMNHRVAFKQNVTDVEKYISFFDSINGRQRGEADYMYERCTLLVVDFSERQPWLFRNSAELKEAGVISKNFQIEYATLGFDTFAEEILDVYASRHDLRSILR